MLSLPIVPFGKYKGQPITDLLNDSKYVEWCKQQPWFQKFPVVYNICVNQTITPNNQNAKTPEHNKIQNMFLEKEIIGKIARSANETRCFRYNKNIHAGDTEVEFEGEYNWDVIIDGLWYNKIQCKCNLDEIKEDDYCCECKYENGDKKMYDLPKIYIEIKPLIGDDYPCILRKMKFQITLTEERIDRDRDRYPNSKYSGSLFVLLIKEYNSTNTPKDKLVEIFKQSYIKVIFINELLDKPQIQLATEQVESLQLVKLSSLDEDNKMLREHLQKAEEKIKQLEIEIISLRAKKQPKTINDYFVKK